ncbi:probable pseudouridine-5'-phosphatase [Drosophila kikkawai]|uniref:Probable pseudouridine-5'-phosphatase n=1 Tax=Drosophila kikkawai TaxID=30033 RepID=A0A6P4I1B4_DROKI|nr:probable pseudouridine-5'-phosphatase [Drosophila kikkawai]KAH8314311.1 hypothetical protein KR059_000901 [Drosophila kikkawai]
MSLEDQSIKPNSRHCLFQPVTHCIFELDGLLINSERLRSESIQKILDPFGHTFGFDLKMRCMGKPLSQQADLIVANYNLPLNRTEFEHRLKLLSRGDLGRIKVLPGVERLLKHLHDFNIPMAIGSSSCRNSFNAKTLRHPKLFDVFHHVVLSGSDEEVKRGKPAPDIFLTTASRFDERPEPAKCLVFESSLLGMEAALAAGMQVVLVPDPLVSIRTSAPATLRLRSLEAFRPQYFGLPPLLGSS